MPPCFTSESSESSCLCARKSLGSPSVTRVEFVLSLDQIVFVSFLEENSIKVFAESEVKKKDDALKKYLSECFPHLFYRSYILNAPTIVFLYFKTTTFFLSKKMRDRAVLLTSNFHKKMDKVIGLKRLPICIGGTNPIPMNEYKNFFDAELEASYQKCKFSLKK